MWKQIKAFVEPFERFITTSGIKKTNVNSSCIPQLSKSFKHVSEHQKQSTTSTFVNSIEKSKLLRFLQETFPVLKSLNEISVPATFTQTSLHFYKSQRTCLVHNYGLLQPAGARNIFSNRTRNFSSVQTAMLNNCTGSGSTILAQLGFKPFSAFATKTGSLWAQQLQINHPSECDRVKKNRSTNLKVADQNKSFTKSKSTIEAIQKKDIIDENMSRIVCHSNITKSLKQNDAVTEIMDDKIIVTSDNVQIYMSFILNSSLFLKLEGNFNINFVTNDSQQNQLNPSFVQNLQEFAEVQHKHMIEVISTLTSLLNHKKYDMEFFGYELKIFFPPGMSISDVKNLLRTLGINPENPHFELKEINHAMSVVLSNSTVEIDTYLDSSLLISPSSSPCMTPPTLKQEYIHEIKEFLSLVDSLISEKDSFGKKGWN
ncbi:12854_t:CDS:1 [Cetraspora pellucida]|uniref:12854_t:CDS:1 n=1 Tax=Cetraspora pellucida TaxID=1433469 RepID=A0A9N9IDD7_9GLOM|nr:12854_t:CDS:1 [Cetraspora pellucida]